MKFIDANVFIYRWNNPKVKEFVDSLEPGHYATSVLVLAEVYHKLRILKIDASESYCREIMGIIKVLDITQNDFFWALRSDLQIPINDRIHIATMKHHGLSTIISFDKDFDQDKTIIREEV